MKRITSSIPAALLTFIVGVVISPIRFKTEAMGHGVVADGGGIYSCIRFRSSYFMSLWFSREGYPSPQKAGEVFERKLANAVRVIERTPKLNERRDRVGERAVVIFVGDSGARYAGAFWTEGRVLYEIYSPSLTHVLDFEKQEER